MTCIAAVTDGKTVWMGGDSAGVGGWDLDVRTDSKVFRNGEFLFGFTTSFRMGQLLRYAFMPPTPHELQDVAAFMATDFVNAVRDCLKAGGWAAKTNEREDGGTFLVGFRGRLFAIHDDYQAAEHADNYAACGCGAAIAKGAMFAAKLCGVTDQRRIVEIGLSAAERHSAGVRGPFVVLSA